MYVPPKIVKQIHDDGNKEIIDKYEHLDYHKQGNYEKLCAEYRDAIYNKNQQLSDALYSLMQRIQKAKPRKSIQKTIVNIKQERKKHQDNSKSKHCIKSKNRQIESKPKQRISPKIRRIIDCLPEEIPREFSFLNALMFFNKHRKASRSFRSAEFVVHFNVDLEFAENVLNLAAKMTILNVLSSHKYFRAKIKNIDFDQYEQFANLSNEQVQGLLAELIEKTGPIQYIPETQPRKRKRISLHVIDEDDRARHYVAPYRGSYGYEINGGSIGSDHVFGGGRKKSREYKGSILHAHNKKSRIKKKSQRANSQLRG